MAIEGTRRPSWAEIDLGALRHNVTTLRHLVAPAQLCGVVKANGYGHGALFAARALLDAGVAGLAVAIVDEGVERERFHERRACSNVRRLRHIEFEQREALAPRAEIGLRAKGCERCTRKARCANHSCTRAQ